MNSILIQHALLVNEGQVWEADLLIQNGVIAKIGKGIQTIADLKIDARGQYLLPGLIDDQVHFREPGLTHKGDLRSETRAALAGGVTSFMDMPNTSPQTLTQEILEAKYDLGKAHSRVNYSFYMGASNDNLEEILRTNPKNVCGVKVFMGASTGNMLVDKESTLEGIFRDSPTLVATHCEREETIKANLERAKAAYGEDIPVSEHPNIRSAEACFESSSMAVALAQKYGTKLHVLHVSTAREMALFENSIPLEKKKITAEACVHHLWFSDHDYAALGSKIKWNPSIKTAEDRAGIWAAVLDGRIDVIATDHAPHTEEEKGLGYLKAPSGGPLVQHSLQALLDFVKEGKLSIATLVQKACHNPAILFQIHHRGFLREGYAADLVLVDPNAPYKVSKENILYKCGWSPFEGHTFSSSITHTFVNGILGWKAGAFHEGIRGERLTFDR